MKQLHLASLSNEDTQELVKTHGNINRAAIFLFENFEVIHKHGTAFKSAETLRRQLSNKLRLGMIGREDPTRRSYPEKLMDSSNIPLDSVKITGGTISSWGVHCKNPDTGEIETKSLYATKLNIIPEAPEFPVVDRAQGSPILYANDAPRLLRKTWQAVVVSDIQAGYLKNMQTGELQPIHDPAAVDVALQITADIKPRKLVFIGDVSDWSFISRWQMHSEFDAVNESIQVSYDILANFVSAAGPQVDEKRMIDSNHALRPERFLLEHNKMAMQIKRAADTSKWPVFSEPYLLRYEELGIEMEGRFPGEEYFMLPKLVFMHAPPKVREFSASVVHGHTHHSRSTPRVAHTHQGREEFHTYDVGCLTSVGKNADKLSLMVTRTPSNRGRTDWNQGLAVVNVVEGKEEVFTVDLIQIRDGSSLYNGQLYEAK